MGSRNALWATRLPLISFVFPGGTAGASHGDVPGVSNYTDLVMSKLANARLRGDISDEEAEACFWRRCAEANKRKARRTDKR